MYGRTNNGKDEIQGSFAMLRMTSVMERYSDKKKGGTEFPPFQNGDVMNPL
jgi:hypothetical protein